MAIVVDTSAWVEYLRATGSPAHRRMAEWRDRGIDELVIVPPIAMELLAGASAATVGAFERLVQGLRMVDVCLEDFVDAATLYRAVRSTGRTVRSTVDCLIAAVAMRADLEVAHRDADFEVLAGVSALRTRSLF